MDAICAAVRVAPPLPPVGVLAETVPASAFVDWVPGTEPPDVLT